MDRMKLATLALAGMLSLSESGCSREVPDPRTGPALVEAGTVSDASTSERSFTGTVSARVQSDLGFRVQGKVVARLVDAGQMVRAGQPLLRIDRTDYGLSATAAGNNVDAARARELQTAADERRYRDLVSAGAVSASRYDQAKADADAAKAQFDAALAQAGVARDEASYSVLPADSDGVVVETLAEPGQVVTAGQVVVRLAHAGPREATISLPETIRPAIGSVAKATLFGGSGVSGLARLRQLSDAADPQTRTFDARYVLEGPAARAPLGSTVSISVRDAGAGPAIGHDIPLSAIIDRGRGPGVWMIVGRSGSLRTHWSPVAVAALGIETVTVSSGLSPGERFVAMGAHTLHEGQPVILSATRIASAQ